jgi:hypothetical protein
MSHPPTTSNSLDTRIVVSSLWVATMIAVAFVDIFGLFRPDIRAQIESGSIYVFEIGQGFLLGAIIYVLIPTLMIPLTLVLPRRANRLTNIIVASLFMVTIIGGAIGEWGYYVLGSAFEAILLVGVIVLAARWTNPALLADKAL